MDKNREIKIIAVVALLVAVVGLSVAYAALSTTLKITGTATINAATWDVKFIEGAGSTAGSASFNKPTVTSTAISDFSIGLVKPGDSVTYTFSIKNNGTIDASLGTVTIGTPTCTATDNTVATTTCGNLTYSVTYADGSAFKVGDRLDAGATKEAKLTLTFNESADVVPSTAVTVNGLGVTLIYNQA